MTFATFAEALEQLEQTSSSLKMIDVLAGLFARLGPEEARVAAYLLRGKVAPDYEGIELGMAEKSVLRAIAARADVPVRRVETAFHSKGDLGDVAAHYAASRPRARLTVRHVFDYLRKIASAKGVGSQATKLRLLADLLEDCSALEAKYVVRVVLGTLRLGVAEMTLLYGLSKAVSGSKEAKPILEAAFNVLSDLGEVVERAFHRGIKALQRVRPVVGKPVRMMLAQRIRNLAEIPEHIPGLVQVEYKYDGERVQAHLRRRGDIVLYSRRQENITHQYPDVVEAIQRSFRGKEAIVEGEVVAVSIETGKLRDFQSLMRRRRKYEVTAYTERIPVKYFLFDLLYLDGKSLLASPLARRREALERHVRAPGPLALSVSLATKDLDEIESFFAVYWLSVNWKLAFESLACKGQGQSLVTL